ncbi:hypothetical protein ASF92_14450 [Pedobacter sp. Leaf176]|nr:hypothetical protein ASF92_14450 [Pedobacter sp. Leaf176]
MKIFCCLGLCVEDFFLLLQPASEEGKRLKFCCLGLCVEDFFLLLQPASEEGKRLKSGEKGIRIILK